MLILSQDKTQITNFDNIGTIEIDKCNGRYDILCTYNDGSSILGGYKTEERAKEVLKEIIHCFSFTQLEGEPEEMKLIFEITKLGRYEMPKE